MATDKKAMSRALGAAFLNHQVEQLEKSAASGNWRSRTPTNNHSPPKRGNNNNSGTTPTRGSSRKKTAGVLVIPRDSAAPRDSAPSSGVRRSLEDSDREREYKERERKREGQREDDEKDADVVVVDASVLVHALHQVKRWCRDGREEVVIVPLEALNTLDLLKKGSSLLAQRARAASRLLEAQVGANPRIKVQRDDAFVLWDGITFSAASPTGPPADRDGIPTGAAETAQAGVGAGQTSDDPAPEWVRRTVCCARFEVEDATTSASARSAPTTTSSDVPPLETTSTSASTAASDATPARTVVLAVLSPTSTSASSAPATSGVGVIGSATTADAPPPNKHEPRASGTLVGRWAARAGVRVLSVTPSPTNAANTGTQGQGQASAGTPPSSSRPRANTGSGAGAGPKRTDRGGGAADRVGGGIEIAKRTERGGGVEIKTRNERGGGGGGSLGRASGGGFGVIGGERAGIEIAKRGHARGAGGGSGERGGSSGGGGSLVERPPALLAMEQQLQHKDGGGPRVVRLLARGERLDGLGGA
ncbi:hypothetical protein B0H16DRAFT_255209 [Mycena metata]|uniref:PIN domain-containing protein n=1 Tax=Mycena metata TaxID=1033252 RepID=A0AAD7NNT7_9AGAR|nr:hypothetical protein B0H16DRAFT_255209 [Mycena metata]